MKYGNIKELDREIYDNIIGESKRQEKGIELIASENYVSEAVLEAMGSILTNKYSEGYPGARYYAGNEFIDNIENIAISRAKELFKADHINVQPYSGSPANLAVYMATLNPGDTVMGMDLYSGGHLTHGFKVSFSGKWFTSYNYGVDENGLINYDEVYKLAQMHKPKLLWAGYSAYSRLIDWSKFQEIAKSVGAVFAVDIAHIAGLIAGDQIDSPIPYADIVTTTTHKTLRGPRGAMIMCKDQYQAKIDKAVFPGLQGGPHNHTTAGIAVALKEAQTEEFKQYSQQVILNSKALCESLIQSDFNIISNGTDNHLMLIDLTNKKVSGKEAEVALEKAGITVNKNTVPFEKRSPFDPSGIRIGTPAITTRGMEEDDMRKVADYINRTILNIHNESALESIKNEVEDFVKPFKIPGIN